MERIDMTIKNVFGKYGDTICDLLKLYDVVNDEHKKHIANALDVLKKTGERENEVKTEVLQVRTHTGYITATKSCDPAYPGIDIEFIAFDEKEDDDKLSCPRILFEQSLDMEEPRALIWNNVNEEDYTEEITFCPKKKSKKDQLEPTEINSTIIPGWKWVEFFDGSGHLEDEHKISYFSYVSKSSEGMIKYCGLHHKYGKEWSEYTGSLDDFRAFAEQQMAKEIGLL